MSNDRWKTQWDIFHEALEQPSEQRRSFVMDACGDDKSLCDDVLNLLESHSESADFLEEPIVVTEGALDALDPKSLLGSNVDAYCLDEVIGEGGMGIVYAAEQSEPVKRSVALKVIRLGMNTEEVVRRFQIERQALAVMDHPSIAKVFDAGVTEDGRPYFVMERVDGISVTRFCDENQLSIRERLDLFCTICDGIQHAHQKGIIHRDIKPSNVLVSIDDNGKPVPRIIDFGIAKATDQRVAEKSVFTQLGKIIGTPAYMSPEQAGLDASRVDTRSDIYSLSVLLYELLTSTTPFPDESLLSAGYAEMQRIICDDDPPPPSTRLSNMAAEAIDTVAEGRGTTRSAIRDQVRGDLDWVIMKALDKTPERRYASAAEFAADIRRHLSNQPIIARPPSNLYRMGKFYRRNRFLVNAAGLVLALGAAFTINTVIQSQKLADALAEARAESSRAEGVTEFLLDLLAEADPNVSQGEAVSVREVLDRGAEQIEAGLDELPGTRAMVIFGIADVYRELGLYEEAGRMLDLLSPMEAEVEDESPAQLGLIYLQRAYLDHDQGDLSSALEHYERAAELIEADGSTGKLIAAKQGLGQALTDLGQAGEGRVLLRTALEMAKSEPDPDWGIIVQLLTMLTGNALELGDYNDALESAQLAVRAATENYGEHRTNAALAYSSLAVVQKRLGHYEEALEAEQSAQAIYERVMGPNHLYTVTLMSNMASTLSQLGSLDEAERLAKEALAIYREHFDETHPNRIAAESNLANVYLKQSKFSEAEAAFRRVLELDRISLGDEHPYVALDLEHIAQTLERQGRYDEALKLQGQVVEMRKTLLEAGHPMIERAQLRYDKIVAKRGDTGQSDEEQD